MVFVRVAIKGLTEKCFVPLADRRKRDAGKEVNGKEHERKLDGNAGRGVRLRFTLHNNTGLVT
jgi:hypothetical protein